ncbi:MAG: PAS-domain containing protein [Proteobacteria bacterium]|nr:PAS-domain containing protein [Pseudomonadota bacterium]
MLIGTGLWFAHQNYREAVMGDRFAAAVVTAAFQLTTLTGDYLLYREERAAIQWVRKHESLGELLRNPGFGAGKGDRIISRLGRDHSVAGNLFARATKIPVENQASGNSPEANVMREKRLMTALLTATQAMVSQASLLSKQNRLVLDAAIEWTTRLILGFGLLSMGLFVGLWLVLARRVVLPIRELKKGIDAFGGGDLDHRLLSRHADEIGEVAVAFNEMAGRLRETLVSRDEMAKEVAERKEAEREISEKSALLEATFESMSQAIAVFDADLKLIANNQRYLDLRAYPKGYIHPGLPYEEIVRFNAERGEYGPGDSEKQVKERLNAARQGKPWRTEYTKADGTVLAVGFDPIPDGGFVATFADITERKKSEREIAEKSAVLETAFESMSQGMTVYDADLKLIGFNQKYIEILGYPADFIRIGRPFEEIARFRAERGEYGPGDAEKLAAKSVKAARQGKATRDEFTRPDGAVFAIRRDPLPDGGFVTTLTDITERKKAEDEVAEKSALLETTFESMSQGIVAYDGDLKLVAFNQNFVDFGGYPADFIRLGMQYQDIVRARAKRGDYGPIEDIDALVRERVAARRKGEVIHRERTLADGRVITVRRDPMPDGGYVTTLTDITERKRAEQEIAEKSAVLETTFESMSQGIVVYDGDLTIVAFNQNYVDFCGYPPDFIRLGIQYQDIVRAKAKRGDYGPVADIEALVRERVAGRWKGGVIRRERTLPDGRIIAVRRDPMPDGGYVTTLTDVTERRKAENEIAEKTALLETTLESMSQGITVYDADHGLIAFNRRFVELFDFPPGFIRAGRTFEELARFLAERGEYGPGDAEELVRERVAARDRGGINPGERTRPNGMVISARRDPMPGGGYVTTYTDITERKRAEAALRESEELFSKVFHASPGMFTISRPEDGAHNEVSANWIATMGYSRDEAMAQTAVELGIWADIGDRIRFVERLKREGSVRDFEAKFRTKSGEELDVLVAGEYLEFGGEPHLIIVAHDITERKRAEAALRAREARLSELQTELLNVSRQSAMGELSSALAHELNQPLAAIMNYVQASRRMMKKGGGVVSEKAYQMMDKALDQADRAGAIMRGLRDIVEKGEAARAASDINKVVEEASALGLIGAARAGIRLDLELGNELPPVNINEIQIQQVVMNLVRNGVEAMAASEKRDLTIKTALDHEDGVEVAIGDTGPGLAEEVEERLFQPFVTTKAGGMGIGLSISHSIVEAHGGRLWATPNPNGGTVFHFTLPLAPNGAEDNDE